MISYWSRQLSKPERNYSTIEREALVAVAAIKEFYPYLYGFSFTLVTDHNPVTALKGLNDVGGRLARWMMYLQQFQLKIEYKPGKDHNDADELSRRPSGSGGGGDGEGNVGRSGGEGGGGDGDGNVGSSGSEGGGGDSNGNWGSSSGCITLVSMLQPTFLNATDIKSEQQKDKDLKPLLEQIQAGLPVPSSTRPGLWKCLLVDGVLCRTWSTE